MTQTNKRLHEKYLDILQKSQEFRNIWESRHHEFSGLFLAGVPENYDGSSKKIMVIGRETRGWGRQFDDSYPLSQYIEEQTKKACDFLTSRSAKQRNDRGSTFHNFLKKLSKKCDQSAVAWANLHCYSWNKSRADKSPLAMEVDIISLELLKAQIDILRPQYIILAHGVAGYSIELRRKIFPNDDCLTILESAFEIVGDKQIWKFKYQWSSDYAVTCFRIQHPSSISKSSRLARLHLIEHLKTLQ